MMALNMFSLMGMRQVALIAALLGCMSLTPAIAVELVGKPVPINSNSESSQAFVDEPVEHSDIDKPGEMAVPIAPPVVNNQLGHPFGGDKHFDLLSEDILIPIVGITFGIGGPILLIIVLVAMHYRAKARREKNINDNIERLLAAGRDIPIELLRGDEPYVGDESSIVRDNINLHKGIKNVCLGIGLFVCLTIMFSIEFGAIGFIVLSVGASQLWVWKLSGSKINIAKDNSQNQG